MRIPSANPAISSPTLRCLRIDSRAIPRGDGMWMRQVSVRLGDRVFSPCRVRSPSSNEGNARHTASVVPDPEIPRCPSSFLPERNVLPRVPSASERDAKASHTPLASQRGGVSRRTEQARTVNPSPGRSLSLEAVGDRPSCIGEARGFLSRNGESRREKKTISRSVSEDARASTGFPPRGVRLPVTRDLEVSQPAPVSSVSVHGNQS